MAEEGKAPAAHHRLRTIGKWAGIAVAGLLALIALLLIAINTDPGRRLVTRFINDFETASGLGVHVDSLEGSIYGELRIHGLRLTDPKGVFFTAPLVELDWRPFAYINNHIDVRSLEIPRASLRRLPELRPSEQPGPLLPDIDIDIGQLELGRLEIGPAVTGQRHLLSLAGSAHIADRRAQVQARARTLEAPGIAGGDVLAVDLDAVPEDNRLAIDFDVQAPRDGLVASLLGLDRPISARASGRGTWKSWKGQARIASAGTSIANLSIVGRDGTFTIEGPVRPGPFVSGPIARLTSPLVRLRLVAALDQRRADIRLQARSAALALAARGAVDFGENRFDGLRVAARLLQPGAVAPDLRARDLRIGLVLNGPFATPRVAYDLQAAAVGVEKTLLEGFRARGAARVDADRILLPVSARVARITGLNPAIGGLLTDVTVNGTLAISGGQILGDDLRVRSDQIDAKVALVANIAAGEYRAAIEGTVRNYRIDGVGILDVTSDFDLVSRTQGISLEGRVAIRTQRIDNETARGLLGGQALIRANVGVGPDGIVRIDNLRVAAPQLTISSGHGRYEPGGGIQLTANGVSKAYGPLTVDISGSVSAPNIRVRASSPGFGIGLGNVTADVRSTARGFAVTASGQSRYGPFEAELTIVTGGGPLTLDIERLTFAGLTFRGRVIQSPAGPFAGTLSVSGTGLDGTVRLSAAGQYQQVSLVLRADAAQVPGDVPITIRRGVIRAQAVLYPDAPAITGDAQLAGVTSGQWRVAEARARIDYRGGNGTVQLLASGSRNVPFGVAVNAALSPSRIRAAMKGSVNGIDFHLAEPAVVQHDAEGWRLAPTRLVLPQGEVRLAARIGNGLTVQSRFDDLDLSLLNAFMPAAGLDGKASGSLDFSQPTAGDFPRAEARLTIEDFTHTGAAVRSSPVDITSAGRLGPQGGAMAAIIRRGGSVVGRAQVRLQPLSPGAGSWTERLLASPLGGGIRYNGPAEVLWSLAGVADHHLSGPIGLAADFGGRVQDPQITGVVRARNLTYWNDSYGTRITGLAVQGRFADSAFVLSQLGGRAGEGTISGQGRIDLSADRGYPIDLRLDLDRARLARADSIGATATGTIRITNSAAKGALISGDLRLPEARYQVIRQGSAEVIELDGVRRIGQPLPPAEREEEVNAPPSIWRLDVRIRADNEVYISGMGLESEWSVNLHVTGTSDDPIVTGRAEVLRGTFSFGGRRFDLQQGLITFTGNRPPDPQINIVAAADVEDITAILRVSGDSSDPRIELTSNPALPQDEVLARLYFGDSVTSLSATQAIQLAASLNALRGTGGGLNPLGKLRSASGIDRLRIVGADEATGRGTAIAAGIHISNDIYVEVITDARGFTATQLEIALSKSLSVLSQVGSYGSSSFGIRYRKDY